MVDAGVRDVDRLRTELVEALRHGGGHDWKGPRWRSGQPLEHSPEGRDSTFEIRFIGKVSCVVKTSVGGTRHETVHDIVVAAEMPRIPTHVMACGDNSWASDVLNRRDSRSRVLI